MANRRQKIMCALNNKNEQSKTAKLTNESDMWHIYLDYKDFPSVFDYRNEYVNSLRFIQLYDINILKDYYNRFEKPKDPFVMSDLQCHELLLMPPSVYEESSIIEFRDSDPFADYDDDNNDKDYVPAQDKISSSSSDSICTLSKGATNAVAQCQDVGIIIPNLETHYNGRQSDTQHCEYKECKGEVFSTCAKCLCFLCWEHFEYTASYKNCQNHMPFYTDQTLNKRKTGKTNKHHETPIANVEEIEHNNYYYSNEHCEYVECNNEITTTCIKCSCFLCVDHFQIFTLNDSCDNYNPNSSQQNRPEVYITKRGKISKRKVFAESLEERNEKFKKMKLEKIAMKDPCDTKCTKKCANNISQTRRQQVHDEYNNLSWEAQGIYIKGLVTVKQVERRKETQRSNPRRKATYAYFISENSVKVPVCKKFFLTTLGFKPNNDRRVLSAIKKEINDQKNKKGSYTRTKNIDKNVIKEHINKYKPTISHYRREHAPNRMYLPSDITIKSMYENFCSENPNLKVSHEVYRKVVRKDLNISFANLGNEECENCNYFQQHDKNHVKNVDIACNICIDFMEHKLKYTTSRQEYQRDVQKANANDDTIYFSVDLQKVIMLPRMDQFKAAIFCPRIIVFNESFVPLGSNSKQLPFAVIWPETVSGRRQEDIISTYRAFFLFHRDVPNVVLWADNCAAQNKNWTLFTFLVYLVNSNETATQTITIKYFEPGHTFMSADSFHHQVEMSLKRKMKVYDFNDFSDSVKKANSSKNIVKEMHISDFYNFTDESSQAKLKKIEPRLYLKDIMAVELRRGHFTLLVKKKHNDEYTQNLDFLKVKYISKRQIPEPTPKSKMRGISEATKNAIIHKLVPLMPENRRRFWCNLPVSESADLDGGT